MCRVSAKNNIYYSNGDKADDLKLAENCLRTVIAALGITYNSDEKREFIKTMLFNIHQSITKLPPEITNKIEIINSEVDEFIKNAGDLLKIDLCDDDQEELNQSIKRIFIKQIIKSIPQRESSELFSHGSDGFSIGISTSANSLSSIKHVAPGNQPIHSLPDYQNTLSIVDETDTIDRDMIFWYSILNNKDNIRSKAYISEKGYGVISFEEYVFEEDIENVFSKIRATK